MSPLSTARWVHVLGLAGGALLITGLFFPWIITNFFEPFPSLETFIRFDGSSALSVGISFFLLLPLLTGILTSLAGLCGFGKRVFFVLHLIFVIVGLLTFLFVSYLYYCIFYCNATGLWALRGTRVLGPGFWLILGGFLVSLGASIAQNRGFKLRAT